MTVNTSAPHAPSQSDFRIDTLTSSGQRCLRIGRDAAAGELLVSLARSRRVCEASYLTVQLDEQTHLELHPSFTECVNHSCAPNVAFDLERMALVALRPITAGDELTYFYPSTEWTMTRPFVCHCGTDACLGTIDGASTLSDVQVASYRLSLFVRRQLAARLQWP